MGAMLPIWGDPQFAHLRYDLRAYNAPMMQGFAAQKYVDTTGNGLVAYFEKQLGKE